MADSDSWPLSQNFTHYRKLLRTKTDEAKRQTIAADRTTAAEALARVRKWRARAEECCSLAESMRSDPARRTLYQLAIGYEALAESWEQAARQRGERERGSPRAP